MKKIVICVLIGILFLSIPTVKIFALSNDYVNAQKNHECFEFNHNKKHEIKKNYQNCDGTYKKEHQHNSLSCQNKYVDVNNDGICDNNSNHGQHKNHHGKK